MLIHFTKMHGLGNDFVVIDTITNPVKLRSVHIKKLSDRHLGIGFDQLLLIEPPTRINADFYFRIFNADGQEVEQCGNGARCAARFFFDMGFTNSPVLKADCLAGSLTCTVAKNNDVTVEMGAPIFEANELSLEFKKNTLVINPVSIGNPHAILHVPDVDTALVEEIGPWLSKHKHFPNETNVGFMQIVDRNHIRLRVYERGVGETLACGSGAAAAAVTGIQQSLLDSPVTVGFSKGDLKIAWEGGDSPILMTGPTTSAFVGRFRL